MIVVYDHQVGRTYSSQRWLDQPDWLLPARHWIQR